MAHLLPNSLFTEVIAATQGVYNSINTSKVTDVNGVKKVVRLEALLPTRTVNVDTTLSLAIKPVIRAVVIFQLPKPSGLNTGAINPASIASKLSLESVTTLILESNVCKNHIIIVATNITVNALVIKSFAFSQRS